MDRAEGGEPSKSRLVEAVPMAAESKTACNCPAAARVLNDRQISGNHVRVLAVLLGSLEFQRT